MSGACASPRPLLLGRYDERDLLAMFVEAGVVDAIEKRGFAATVAELDASEGPLTHLRLFAVKGGARFLLLDACLTELGLQPAAGLLGGYAGKVPVDLVVVYWLREQDPTASFDADHRRLPLQQHPGLGVLRRAFRVALRLAKETGKQGIAALPKFFHDAAIFYHSRLFLFLDPDEQGRFEALLRDLAALSLADASLALLGNAVTDAGGAAATWQPGLQVMPLEASLTEFFHGEHYQTACRAAFETSRFTVDPRLLGEARAVFERSLAADGAALH